MPQHRAGPAPYRGPRFAAQAYIALRGDNAANLTRIGVLKPRWTGLDGRRVVIGLVNVRTWDAGVPELVGRLLVDAGAAEAHFQAQGEIAEQFAAEAERGARQYQSALR